MAPPLPTTHKDESPASTVTPDVNVDGLAAVAPETSSAADAAPTTEATVVASSDVAAAAEETSATEPLADDMVAADEVGACAEYKRLDQVWDAEDSQWYYRESAPPPPHRVRIDEFDHYCFTVVRELNHKTMQPDATEISLKSTWLKKTCRSVIGDIDEVNWGRRNPRVDPAVLVRFYPLLETHLATLRARETVDEQKVAQLQVLLDFIRADYESTFSDLEYATSRAEITFAFLGHILLPGTILFSACSQTGEPVASRLTSAQLVSACRDTPAHWKIEAVSIDSTGSRSTEDKFGWAKSSFSISDFKGTVKICTLSVYPLQWNPKQSEVRAQLIERGKRWEALDGVYHMRYDGVAYDTSKRMIVNSRVMVDLGLYNDMSGNSSPSVIPPGPYSSNNYDSGENSDDAENDEPPFAFLASLSDDELLLTPALVYGFSLSDKLWLQFNVLLVTDIKWNDEAFKRLVLPTDQKDMIRGLVEAQSVDSFEFDDYVEGKGRGLVINLFGPPGVGKTLSAEATSEHLRRPLYVVGAGDLGTRPSDLNWALTRIFKIGATWRAVVLIDEADVFLEQRSLHDLDRNALVAVFLRQLEYFAGLLFLTTNRVRSFDEAFQSRIHVSLRYRDLEEEARRTIWYSFLEKLGIAKGDLSVDEENDLVRRPLNGRQIKNAVRTAGALASSRKEKVAYSHLESVVKIMEQFEKDFHSPTAGGD